MVVLDLYLYLNEPTISQLVHYIDHLDRRAIEIEIALEMGSISLILFWILCSPALISLGDHADNKVQSPLTSSGLILSPFTASCSADKVIPVDEKLLVQDEELQADCFNASTTGARRIGRQVDHWKGISPSPKSSSALL
jgi:3D (Asp-Asp-Asp) domain-containing protein